jgi:predicted TIM-barrel fold metal-dependent hydrolase
VPGPGHVTSPLAGERPRVSQRRRAATLVVAVYFEIKLVHARNLSSARPRAIDYLEALVRAGLGQRLMFGSDQMRWPDKIGEGLAAIEEAPFLTKQLKRDILFNNAARFLRLDTTRLFAIDGSSR